MFDDICEEVGVAQWYSLGCPCRARGEEELGAITRYNSRRLARMMGEQILPIHGISNIGLVFTGLIILRQAFCARWRLLNQKPLSAGIALGFGCSGGGSHDLAGADQKCPWKYGNLSGP
jgi:hypothetical protein